MVETYVAVSSPQTYVVWDREETCRPLQRPDLLCVRRGEANAEGLESDCGIPGADRDGALVEDRVEDVKHGEDLGFIDVRHLHCLLLPEHIENGVGVPNGVGQLPTEETLEIVACAVFHSTVIHSE